MGQFNLILALVAGGIAGYIAGRVIRGEGYGVVGNILLGLVGSIIGRILFALLGLHWFNNLCLIGPILVSERLESGVGGMNWKLATLLLLVVVMLLFSTRGERTFLDLWLTPDQQGQRLFNHGEFGDAAERFSDPMHRGMALFVMLLNRF